MPRSQRPSAFDIDKVTSFIGGFTARHRTALTRLGARQSQIFEVACAAAAADHYAAAGYAVTPLNPPSRNSFHVKWNARGHPADYSRFIVERGADLFELHLNCVVRSARDDGIYCIDVAILPVGTLPRAKKRSEKWVCAPNAHLVSFIEAKRLPVYPMLIAQFIGIVHEITPVFMRRAPAAEFVSQGHFVPTLVSIGSYSANAQSIVAAFRRRKLWIRVLENFDVRLARADHGRSVWDGPAPGRSSAVP